MAGGYVAGSQRVPRWHEAGDETEFRDGLHGRPRLGRFVAVLISAALVCAPAKSFARTYGADVAGKDVAGATSRTNSPTIPFSTRYYAQARAHKFQNMAASTSDELRGELSRILAGTAVASGSSSAENRANLANLVAEMVWCFAAGSRKSAWIPLLLLRGRPPTKQETRSDTNWLRHAAGLILSLACRLGKAIKGGEHRDNSVPARFQFDRRLCSHPSLEGSPQCFATSSFG